MDSDLPSDGRHPVRRIVLWRNRGWAQCAFRFFGGVHKCTNSQIAQNAAGSSRIFEFAVGNCFQSDLVRNLFGHRHSIGDGVSRALPLLFLMEQNKRRKGTYKYIKYPDNEGRGNCIKFRALFPFGAFCLFFLS